MRLPEPIRERLQTEFRFAADSMAATPDLAKKVFFFSALYGEANRSLNEHWDTELALVHLVLVSAHRDIFGRISQPPLLSGEVPQELPEALTKVAADLAELFQDSEQDTVRLYEVLARVAEVAYTATGNGYYLYLKGTVKL